MRIRRVPLIAACVVVIAWSISGESAAARSLWTDVARSSPRREAEPTAMDAARAWFRIAIERGRRGEYEAALDANRRQLALGTVDPAVVSNGAELLMALGRLDEAIEQYREALAIEERNRDRNSRGDIQGLALGYFGLAVALDRNADPVAAREAMGRGLALDGATAVLQQAQQSQSDATVFFLPPGDVFYYLGLVREAQGRGDDAAAAFRAYLTGAGKTDGKTDGKDDGKTAGKSAQPPVLYARRARDHLARLAALGSRGQERRPETLSGPAGESRSTRLRIVHQATLAADGPLVAPLVDAAWRLHGQMLDPCLSDVEVPGDPHDEPVRDGWDGRDSPDHRGLSPVASREFKVRLEVNLDDQGVVSAVTAELPRDLPISFKSCIEDAVRTRFRTSRPNRPRPTRARIELVLAPAGPSG